MKDGGFIDFCVCKLAKHHFFSLFFPCLAGQACLKACAKYLLSFSKIVGIYTYIYICLYIYIYIYHMAFLFFFFSFGRDSQAKKVMFLLFFICFMSSLEANFQCTINAYLLLYFLLAYKVKSCWLNKNSFPSIFLVTWPATYGMWGPHLLHFNGLVTF